MRYFIILIDLRERVPVGAHDDWFYRWQWRPSWNRAVKRRRSVRFFNDSEFVPRTFYHYDFHTHPSTNRQIGKCSRIGELVSYFQTVWSVRYCICVHVFSHKVTEFGLMKQAFQIKFLHESNFSWFFDCCTYAVSKTQNLLTVFLQYHQIYIRYWIILSVFKLNCNHTI